MPHARKKEGNFSLILGLVNLTETRCGIFQLRKAVNKRSGCEQVLIHRFAMKQKALD